MVYLNVDGSNIYWRTFSCKCDNLSTIATAKNPVLHNWTKNMGINCHYLAEKINCGIICPIFVISAEQKANIFTKKTARSLLPDIGVQAGHG